MMTPLTRVRLEAGGVFLFYQNQVHRAEPEPTFVAIKLHGKFSAFECFQSSEKR
jgi:hypothetical protein